MSRYQDVFVNIFFFKMENVRFFWLFKRKNPNFL